MARIQRGCQTSISRAVEGSMSGRVKQGRSAASLIEQAERSGGAYIVFSYMERYFITQSRHRRELIKGAVIIHETKPGTEWRIPDEASPIRTHVYKEGHGYVRIERFNIRGERTIERYRPALKTSVAQRKADKKYRDSKLTRRPE